MTYKVYKPKPLLQPFIDVYWYMAGHIEGVETITLLPDGGVNLLVNLGEDILSTGFEKRIKYGGVFMVGPMMKTDVQVMENEALLFGVRFKPGAFSCFYKHEALDQLANMFQDFPQKDFPDLKKTLQHFVPYFDQFFLDRLAPSKVSVVHCAADIAQSFGAVRIETLAKQHFTSERQLERQFKQQVGLSPKKLADLERFNNAYVLLQSKPQKRIEEIAWNCGYYDQAHMTNDFKRFTGQTPAALILSDFSKKVADESR
jgi:AraC-like DNA-binding protein